MKPLALRTQLTLSYAAILALLLTVLGVTYYSVLARQLEADATTDLEQITSGLHGYLRFTGPEPALVYDHSDPDQVAFVAGATRYYQIYDASTGVLLLQSPALAPLGLHYTVDEVRTLRDAPVIRDMQTDQGRLRLSHSVLTPANGRSYLLQVGVPLDAIDSALGRFVGLLLWSVPTSLLLALVTGRWMAARALAPLVRMATATRRIDVADLGQPLPLRGGRDELDEVAGAFNEMLARLEHAVGEMRQFSAAIAHELRAPLAALRARTELALLGPGTPDDYRRGLEDQLDDLDRLARLITQLLTLARAEAGEIPLLRVPIDLAALAASLTEQLEPVAQAEGVSLECAAAGPVPIVGDPGWIERLLLNLLDNAIKFTASGGRIRVRVHLEGVNAVLEVSDTGIGIAAEALPHIFERFYRADPARSPLAEGAGLGLTLVKWITDRHGGVLSVSSAAGDGSVFILRIPAAPVPGPAAVQP